jgi:hypothetical protein
MDEAGSVNIIKDTDPGGPKIYGSGTLNSKVCLHIIDFNNEIISAFFNVIRMKFFLKKGRWMFG